MANAVAQVKTESTNLNAYWSDSDPTISGQAREILVGYSGIPEEQLVSHIRAVRDQAWAVFKYPCIGNYYFLDFSITQSPQYPSVLGRLQQGESLLDLACCLGQDIRKLVYDGAPTDNVFGSELERGFIELGFELFKDQDILGKNFSSGDIFSVDVAGLAGKQFDIIHAASFFHLFSWDEQVDAMGRALSLLKPKAGSMIFGRQTAVLEAGEIEHPASRSGSMYRHNVASFTALISQVAKQCGKKVSISVTPQDEMEQLEAAHGWHRMAYGVLLV